jgi:hypothetical protein
LEAVSAVSPPPKKKGRTPRAPKPRNEPDAKTLARRNWRTPDDLFAALHQRFAFNIDLAADETNHKLPYWFGPGGLAPDGLAVSWGPQVRGFLNPPGFDPAWIYKVWAEFRPDNPAGRPQLVVAIMPATRTEQPWWHDCVERFRDKPDVWQQMGVKLSVEFFRERIEYVPPPGVEASRAGFGSCLLIWEIL